ncbi:Respiratory growth induced protein 1 [Frankliniella fusca]|uniref:Respiratory growth induced protein 1 n=1 Tax=Frankliniella fusca TaxID=407009 RepID=A0AAE1L892_9NEOP|nr:Respiratory growth induced protein 1 [Frankliniella fusca]
MFHGSWEQPWDFWTGQLTDQLADTHLAEFRLAEARRRRDEAPPVPKFDGTRSWVVFDAQFKAAADDRGWSPEVRGRHLLNSLQGAAADVVQTLPPADFGDCEWLRPGRHYPTWPDDAFQTKVCEAFLDGLVDADLRRNVRLQNPGNVNAALTAALHIEAVDTLEPVPKRARFARVESVLEPGTSSSTALPPPETPTAAGDVLDARRVATAAASSADVLVALDKLRDTITAAMQTRTASRSPPRQRRGACYYCGGEGRSTLLESAVKNQIEVLYKTYQVLRKGHVRRGAAFENKLHAFKETLKDEMCIVSSVRGPPSASEQRVASRVADGFDGPAQKRAQVTSPTAADDDVDPDDPDPDYVAPTETRLLTLKDVALALDRSKASSRSAFRTVATAVSQASASAPAAVPYGASYASCGASAPTPPPPTPGRTRGRSVLCIEKRLQRRLVYLACRHHMFDLIPKALFQTMIEPSFSPDVGTLCRNFKKSWPSMNQY